MYHAIWLGSQVFPVLDGYSNGKIGASDFVCPNQALNLAAASIINSSATYYPGVGWLHFYNYLGGWPMLPPQPAGWPRVVTDWVPPLKLSDGTANTAIITDNTISSQTFGTYVMHTPRGPAGADAADRRHPTELGCDAQLVGYTDTHVRWVPIGLTKEYNVCWNSVGITTFW